MRKFLFTKCFITISIYSNTQFVDFKSLTLSYIESYNNGSDSLGSFIQERYSKNTWKQRKINKRSENNLTKKIYYKLIYINVIIFQFNQLLEAIAVN